MKKMLVLFAAVAAMSAVAENYFSRTQFQQSQAGALDAAHDFQLTVPMIYKGTIAAKLEAVDDSGAANGCVTTRSVKSDAYMTMCQPCIDCAPCTIMPQNYSDAPLAGFVAGGSRITRWDLFTVTANKRDRWASLERINLLDAGTNVFFTGEAKKGAYVYYNNVDTDDGTVVNFALMGNKNDYTFKYTNAVWNGASWDKGYPALDKNGNFAPVLDAKANANTAYIKSVSAFSGSLYAQNTYDWDNDGTATYTKIEATVKLTRNASLMKKAIAGSFGIQTSGSSKGWDDCGATTLNCEEYLSVASCSQGELFGEMMKSYNPNRYVWYVYLGNADNVFNNYISALFNYDDPFLTVPEEWEYDGDLN